MCGPVDRTDSYFHFTSIFTLSQSMQLATKAEVGRIKVNRINFSQNKLIKTEYVLTKTE